MVRLFITFIVAAIVLLLGLCCLVAPKTIQRIVVKACRFDRPSRVEAINRFRHWRKARVESGQYVARLRIVGFAILVFCAIALWALSMNW